MLHLLSGLVVVLVLGVCVAPRVHRFVARVAVRGWHEREPRSASSPLPPGAPRNTPVMSERVDEDGTRHVW